MARELITQSQYTQLADEQRQTILKATDFGTQLALSSDQWRIASAHWLLIQKGVYLPLLTKRIQKQLSHASVREEANNYIRSHRLTLDMASEILGCEKELAEFHRVESERPVLVSA